MKNYSQVRLGFLLLVCLTLLFVLINLNFLLDIPPVWIDEALHADIALNVLTSNLTGTKLLSGTLPGVETFGFGYPPLYFYTSALWIKLFGFSIFTYRLLSLCFGIIFLIVFSIVSLEMGDKNERTRINSKSLFLLAIGLLLLMIDIGFIKAIHIARPEIEVLVLGFLSIFFYLKVPETKEREKKVLLCVLSGFSLGLAFITHYLALIFLVSLILYIIFLDLKGFYKHKEFYIFGLSFLSLLILWIISIYPNLNYLLNSIGTRKLANSNSPSWLWLVFASSSLSTKIVYIFYFIVSWEVISKYGFSLTKNMKYKGLDQVSKDSKEFLILALNLSAWVFTYIWQTESSFIYAIVCTYLAVVYLLKSSLEANGVYAQYRFKVYIIIAASFLMLNSLNLAEALNKFKEGSYSYELYIDSLKPLVPEGTTLFISAVPDPFFAFHGRNDIREASLLPTTKEDIEKVLDNTDYVIFNFPHELTGTGNVTMPYINRNAETVVGIGREDQYAAIVVKLKPKGQKNRVIK